MKKPTREITLMILCIVLTFDIYHFVFETPPSLNPSRPRGEGFPAEGGTTIETATFPLLRSRKKVGMRGILRKFPGATEGV